MKAVILDRSGRCDLRPHAGDVKSGDHVKGWTRRAAQLGWVHATLCKRRAGHHIVVSSEKPCGCSEPPVPVISPAIVNALSRLMGKRYRSLPLANI